MGSAPPEPLDEVLHEHDCRATPQRSRVYAVLLELGGHPTADEVHEQARHTMPTLSLRTVYDVLHLFVDLGLIHRLDTGTGAIRFDTNLEPHAHVVCPSCHDVREADLDLVQLRRALHEQELDRVDVVVHQRCATCA